MNFNTVLNLNNIIYRIYNTKDFNLMRRRTLSLIVKLIPCTCASISINEDADMPYLSDTIMVPEEYIELENTYTKMQKEDGSIWILYRKQSGIYKDTDLMTDDVRTQTSYYQKCLKPYGLHYSVDVTIADGKNMLGIMTIYRTEEEGDFTDEDIELLSLLSDHLNARFSMDLTPEENIGTGHKIESYITKYNLTSREAEVLDLIFDGDANETIEAKLCISQHTLKKHLQNLYRKTEVSGRIQLKALGQGW